MKIPLSLPCLAFSFLSIFPAPAADGPPEKAVQPLSPEQEQATFQLAAGYRADLVLAEPFVEEPVAVSFDGDGRMYVVEMASYMQDIDGKDEMKPVSRITRHDSSRGDGVYDQHTVFADNLLLPRMILPLGPGQLVIGETNSNELNLFTDVDGDGKADKKEVWFPGGNRGGNLEHQPSGLVWAIDNGIYTTYNNYRLRWTPKGVIKEASSGTEGQWGMTQDDDGHLYLVNASGEMGPLGFQEPLVYGNFNPGQQLARGFMEVFPLRGVGDFQGGPNRIREDGTLNNLTSCAGAEIYRGNLMPELKGSLFFGEPAGRLVRQAKVDNRAGMISLSNPYQKDRSEFMRSTDLCFRPVNMATAPDGSLYIVDMYRGIIQEGNWVTKGSHLRKMVEEFSLDKIVGRGRIWRITGPTAPLGPWPRMYSETSSQLVGHLGHPNGWWRDTAQKLLILRQDRSVVPELEALARTEGDSLSSVHALWTLQGLDALSVPLVGSLLKNPDPKIRTAAIRVQETLYQKGETTLKSQVLAMVRDPDPSVAKQAILTARLLKWDEWREAAEAVAKSTPYDGVKLLADATLSRSKVKTSTQTFTPAESQQLERGATTFTTLCAACHGPDGRGMPMMGAPAGTFLAPSLLASPLVSGPKEGPIAVLLNGLTGPIDGKTYDGVMMPMGNNSDEWLSDVLSYLRVVVAKNGSFVSPADVADIRTKSAGRSKPWTIAELRAVLPAPLPRDNWKVTASHRSNEAFKAIDRQEDTRWTSGESQHPGIWFQVELPAATTISGVQWSLGSSTGDAPRGYEITVSDDGITWSKPIAIGTKDDSLDINFPSVRTKFVRITLKGRDQLYWSIHELEVLGERKGIFAGR